MKNILCAMMLWLICSNWATAQKKLTELEALANETSNLGGTVISDNGRWIKFWEAFPIGTQTVVVDRNNPSNFLKRSGVSKQGFFGQDRMFWLSGKELELVFLAENRKIAFANVQNVAYVNSADVLLVHYNQTDQNKVKIYNTDGREVGTIENVIRWNLLSNGIAFTVQGIGSNEIFLYQNGKKDLLFQTKDNVQHVSDSESSLAGLIIYVKNQHGENKIILRSSKGEYLLNSLLNFRYSNIVQIPSPVKDALYFTASPVLEPDKKEVADIWYGNDYAIANNKWKENQVQIFWYPSQDSVTIIDKRGVLKAKILMNNPNFILGYDESELNDYTLLNPDIKYNLLDLKENKKNVLGIIPGGASVFTDPKGKWLILPRSEGWYIYNTFTGKEYHYKQIPSIKHATIDDRGSIIPYFIGSDEVLWIGGNQIILHHLVDNRSSILASFKSSEVRVLNQERVDLYGAKVFSLNKTKSLILRLSDIETRKVSYLKWDRKNTEVIIPATPKFIKDFVYSPDLTKFSWITEDFNTPPTVFTKDLQAGMDKMVYRNEKNANQASGIQAKKISYAGANGELLSGILFLPSNMDEDKKYPVFVEIYERMSEWGNRFLQPSFDNAMGVNHRLLLEMGYLVFLPDISYNERGPGLSALQCVHNALNQLSRIKQVDGSKIALNGSSFGGYETNFIATHSDRFATYISGVSLSDVVMAYYGYHVETSKPQFHRFESWQFRMGGSLTNYKQKYLDNSPVLFAKNIKKPILLWAGSEDKNIDPNQTMAFYNALKREKVPVVALYYAGVGHSIRAKDPAGKDLTLKIIDWLDYFLKGERDIAWIDKQMVQKAQR